MLTRISGVLRRAIRRVWIWTLLVALVLLSMDVVAARPASDSALDGTHRVVFRLTGQRSVRVVYQSVRKTYFPANLVSSPKIQTLANQPLPWTKTMVVKGDYTSFRLLAYPTAGMPNAPVTCTITVDGKLAWKAISVGKNLEVRCFALGLGGR